MDAKYEQIDRIGLPHFDEIFFGEAVLLEMRSGSPTSDAKELAPLIEDSIANSRSVLDRISGFPKTGADALSPEEIADLWTPNVVFIDVDEPVSLKKLNGRPLEGEDSFDEMVSIAFGSRLEDQIAVINRGLRDQFPYLAPPRKSDRREDREPKQ